MKHPVVYIGTQGVSTPIVKSGKVVGFSDDWFAQRMFPVDMAGFAINIEFMRKMAKICLKMSDYILFYCEIGISPYLKY